MPLLEVAKTAKSVTNMALFVGHDGPNVRCILYDPTILEELYRVYSEHYGELSLDRMASIQNSFTIPNPVYGMMRLDKKTEYNTWIVQSSAAEKGYGPLMYDIAFSFAGKSGLAPDRQSITPKAINIWNYIFTNRRDEFDFFPLKDQSGNESQRYTDYGMNQLDQKVVMKIPNNSVFQSLFQKNRVVLSTLKQIKTNFEPKKFLAIAARQFFLEKYAA